MDNSFNKKFATIAVIIILGLLSFFLLRPFFLAIITGFIFTFMLSPIYNQFYKWTKSKNFSAAIVCLLLAAVILIPLILSFPFLIEQLLNSYNSLKQIDLATPLKILFPNVLTNDAFVVAIETTLESGVNNIITSIINLFTIDNIVSWFFQIIVIFFILFFALRDKENLIIYIKSLLPFSKEIEKRLFESTKNITSAVLFGQIIVGIMQGIILGAGLFIFKVPNALILSLLALVVGIFPIIGPSLIGIPVAIYFLIGGSPWSALGILIFTLAASLSEQFFKPLFVAKKTKLHTSLVFIGMIGGFLLFGILGFILGPLILAYLVIIIEIYRNKHLPEVFIQNSKE